MDVTDWLARGAVADKGGVATKRAALAAAADLAARRTGVDAALILERLLDREGEGSTGVGAGVAVPHAQLPELERMTAVFLRLEPPVAFNAVDGRPVDLLFALFAPEGDSSGHLRTLARVSRLLRRAELREQLRAARSADAIYALLAEAPASSAA